MSAFLYLASDHPLPERPNPHFRTLSVREALELGMEVPDFLLEPGVDQDALDTILWSDLELRIDTAAPLPADPGPDDDFAVWPMEEKLLDMQTEKPYCACVEWGQYSPGRGRLLLEYLREQMQHTKELEFWHIWMDGALGHPFRQAVIPLTELTVEDISELAQADFSHEPPTDYCFRIIR